MFKFGLLFLFFLSANSFAQDENKILLENFALKIINEHFQDSEMITLGQKLDIDVIPIDIRTKISKCNVPLKGKMVSNQLKRNVSVKVSCEDDTNWNIYLRARIKVLTPTVITQKNLTKGVVLSGENLTKIYKEVSQVGNGTYSDLELLIGARLKRNISKYRPIKARDICYVCKNDKVILLAKNSIISIRASGIALNDANLDETIRVKNSKTNKIVTGTVIGLKKVQVYF